MFWFVRQKAKRNRWHMTEITLSHMIRALHQEHTLPDWEKDFVAEAYAASKGGNQVFCLTIKQIENVTTIFKRMYQ